ncbi:hypothetical protein LMG23992_03258 [Cupriavidus laharis]|uniref:Type VI secretion protein VasK n=1 Tax=Cupriavidus laharis TaxID=151654 RepID=A0ABM8X8P9_9BURK|nr:ImcF-related family protein [Cupriavidus laharis]CAG9176379.1 hypothetical protein LMG23992_03258 [Cupriavidus laharis]
MSDNKPIASAGVFLGIALFFVYVTLAVSAWALRPAQGWSIEWLTIIELGLLVGFLLGLVFLKPMQAIILWMSNLKAARFVAEQFRKETASDRQKNAAQTGQIPPQEQFRALREALRTHYGWRWRYRQPWLLITGDDSAIVRLLPGLATSGWLLTVDAILLRSTNGPNHQPDTAWLKQLYKLRRSRPIDAIVVVTDGEATLPKDRLGTHSIALGLTRITEALRWSAPIYILDAVPTKPAPSAMIPVVACDVPSHGDASTVETALQVLRSDLSFRYIASLTKDAPKRHLGELSHHLDSRSPVLAEWIAGLLGRRYPVRGVVFAPGAIATTDTAEDANADLPLWQYLGDSARLHRGRRTAGHPITWGTGLILCAIAFWTSGMLLSGWNNTRDVSAARQAVSGIQSAPNAAARLRALMALQQEIERFEYRTQYHAPWLTRFGLNRDPEVLAALWKPYTQAARQLLITPVQQNLEASLVDLGQLQTTSLDDQTSKWAMGGRDGLKAYLMLSNPDRTAPGFLASQLASQWSTEARIAPGEKQDLSERLFRFYAEHLKANPDWKIDARPELVAGARQTLLAVIGARNAQDTVYQQILDGVGSKYSDQTLASLTVGTDTHGLLHASAIVPGVFTRQAYEGYIADAIEEAVKRRDVSTDWVLVDGHASGSEPRLSADELRAALTQQYFADYAEHWQDFMNALQWEPAPALPAAIGQLKLLADARQSPVIALMKSLEYQGGAGRQKASLSDALVTKAKDIFSNKGEAPQTAKPEPTGPLDAAFGPVLRLVGLSSQGTANSDLSLQRFLDRATALRLRLQQVNASPDADAQARQMAQALFQGKGSELADTQAYAQLMAASLGTEWAGMGETLFVRPITQAMQTIVLPAQASLNEGWQRSILVVWNQLFAGRYPFTDTPNDASLPEFAQFARPQGGRIQMFLSTQLAGMLELQGDQWVPTAAARDVRFDPEFLKFINIVQRIGSRMMAQGEPQYRFELKPVPTPGLTDTVLIIDDQRLHYYNQRETWQRMTWPASNLQDPGARLQWQSETAMTNKSYEFGGRFGLLRMLARAHIEQVDGATYQIGWRAVPDTGASADGSDAAKAPEIRFLLRSEAGPGALDMLTLQGLNVPQRVFMTGKASTAADAAPSPANRDTHKGSR